MRPAWQLAILSGIAAMAVLLAARAWGHGEAAWIASGKYHDAMGRSCCNEQDCRIIYPLGAPEPHADGSVSYVIEIDGEPRQMTTAAGGVHPSRTLDYWMCAWQGETTDELADGRPRCFFWPGTASASP